MPFGFSFVNFPEDTTMSQPFHGRGTVKIAGGTKKPKAKGPIISVALVLAVAAWAIAGFPYLPTSR